MLGAITLLPEELKVTNTDNPKCWQGYRTTILYIDGGGGEGDMIWSKYISKHFDTHMHGYTSFNPANPFPGMYLSEMKAPRDRENIHGDFLHNSSKLVTTQKPINSGINQRCNIFIQWTDTHWSPNSLVSIRNKVHRLTNRKVKNGVESKKPAPKNSFHYGTCRSQQN
jgi:hypothetical protein